MFVRNSRTRDFEGEFSVSDGLAPREALLSFARPLRGEFRLSGSMRLLSGVNLRLSLFCFRFPFAFHSQCVRIPFAMRSHFIRIGCGRLANGKLGTHPLFAPEKMASPSWAMSNRPVEGRSKFSCRTVVVQGVRCPSFTLCDESSTTGRCAKLSAGFLLRQGGGRVTAK